MKSILIAGAIVALSSSAYAADTFSANSYSWSGAYAGINAGYAANNNKLSDGEFWLRDYRGPLNDPWFHEVEGSEKGSLTGGFQAGYNYQINRFVLGVEADFNFLNLKTQQRSSHVDTTYRPDLGPDYVYNLTDEFNVSSKVSWFGTLRARAGALPTERLMVYATGGLAYGKVKQSSGYGWREHGFWWGGGPNSDEDHFFDRSDSEEGVSSGVRTGWAAGAGLEYALTEKLTIKGEYLFVDLGKKGNFASVLGGYAEVGAKDNVRFSTVRVGLNYKF